ncbi:hypothetical protein M8J77_008645 [Diaphorina citri]|nr:hypothetical protein M8J77_008645 [Diaphorina citri]
MYLQSWLHQCSILLYIFWYSGCLESSGDYRQAVSHLSQSKRCEYAKCRKSVHDQQQSFSFRADLVVGRVLLFTVATLLELSTQTETIMAPAFVELDNPCGHSIKDFRHFAYNSKTKYSYPEITPEQSRKITIRSLKHVGVALDEVLYQLRSQEPSMKEVYPDMSMMYQFSETRFNWLPDKQLNWYKREVRCMTKINKVLTVLPVLAHSLRNYSVAFRELSMLRGSCYLRISDPPLNIRNNLLSSLYRDTKKVLCVVSEALDNFGCDLKPTSDYFDPTDSDWDSNPDCTSLITQDAIIIERYRNFVATWKKIIKLVFDTTKYNRQPCKKKPKLPRCSKTFHSKIKKPKETDAKSKKKDVETNNDLPKVWEKEVRDKEQTDNEVDEMEIFKD